MTVSPLLRYEAVSKWYGPITALMGVDFEVGAEVVGLVGRNGAGKSTLLRIGAGLLRATQGEVQVLGHPAGSLAARAALGFCPDTDRLYEGLSGREFVAWLLCYQGYSRRRARELAEATLDRLGLGSAMRRPIREYSKGMRQRVRLAQALAHEPRVVLLDEPMTGLDPIARSELAAVITALPATGVGVLVSSHVLHELEEIVDRVVLVHQGRKLSEGTVAELRERVPGQPRRYRLSGSDLRALSARIVVLSAVIGVSLVDGRLDVMVADPVAFERDITMLAALGDPAIDEFEPLDEDLGFVFGKLLR